MDQQDLNLYFQETAYLDEYYYDLFPEIYK